MKTTKELFGQLQKEIIIHTKYKEDFTSIPSGFYHLGDLKTGEIIGILGPNSEKLVTFALSTAISAAYDKAFVMFFSSQHSTEELFDRIIAHRLRYYDRNIEELKPKEVKWLLRDIEGISNWEFYIAGKQEFALPNIKKQFLDAWAHAYQPRRGLIVLDFSNSTGSIDSEILETQFEDMFNDMKTLAKKLGIVFLVLSPFENPNKEQVDLQDQIRCSEKTSLIDKFADVLILLEEDSSNAQIASEADIEIIDKNACDRKTITLCYLTNSKYPRYTDYFQIS